MKILEKWKRERKIRRLEVELDVCARNLIEQIKEKIIEFKICASCSNYSELGVVYRQLMFALSSLKNIVAVCSLDTRQHIINEFPFLELYAS